MPMHLQIMTLREGAYGTFNIFYVLKKRFDVPLTSTLSVVVPVRAAGFVPWSRASITN